MIMDFGCYAAYYYWCMVPYNSAYLPGSGNIKAVADADALNDAYHQVGSSTYSGWAWGGDRADFMTGRHAGGVSVGYADGHAKWLPSINVYQGALNHWNNYLNKGVSGYTPKPDPWDPAFSAD
jgi:prepilin-type processing-associated H-X9-DG protein